MYAVSSKMLVERFTVIEMTFKSHSKVMCNGAVQQIWFLWYGVVSSLCNMCVGHLVSFLRHISFPVMSQLTFSFTCQLISITITTLIIHHSFTLSLQAQNLPFQQILPTLDFFYLHDNGTGPDLSCLSFYF